MGVVLSELCKGPVPLSNVCNRNFVICACCVTYYLMDVFRLLCRDSGGETESMLLNETVPQWVIDITVDVSVLHSHFALVFFPNCEANSDLV